MSNNIVFIHYSSDKPFNGEIIRGRVGEFITAKLPCSDISFLKRGDPLVVGQQDSGEENGVKCFGGNIVDTYKSQNMILISPDKIYNDTEKRQFTRHKVSLAGYLRGNANKNEEIWIKDISYAGLGIYSDKEMDVDCTVTIDMFLGGLMYTSEGIVVRKAVAFGRNEYGIQLLHRDKQSIYYTQNCIDSYLVNEINQLRRSLGMF
ncbi:MAG: PilZ domain-containing protein [Ruminiclostridium sp.]|nr:PilZ domain-containing protein [Ruminiclostridium sp.]